MLKNKNNTTQKRPSPYRKTKIFLVILTLFIAGQIVDVHYRDWDNAQLIKGLHKDFPLLVEEINTATGLDLQHNVECSITTEKFSNGVRTCEFSVAARAEHSVLGKAYSAQRSSDKFRYSGDFMNMEGYTATYRNKEGCSIRTQETIYTTCLTAVREANIDLARELFIK